MNEGFAKKVLAATCIGAGVVLLLLLLWHSVDVLLLAFAGVLLAVFLNSSSDWVSRKTSLSGPWSLAIVILALLGTVILFVWSLAPLVASQLDALTESLPRSARQLEQYLEKYQWGRRVLDQTPGFIDLMPERSSILSRATGLLSSTLGVVTNILIVLFVGLYLAASPRIYLNGVVSLVPEGHRARAREVLGEVGATLRRFLVGRMILMVTNGAAMSLGLWLLGVPFALTLGLLSALLNFIPNLGPIIAAVPAILVALTQGPTRALYVFFLYLGYQSLDGYLLTPLVQRRTVAMPAALTIMAQVLLGVLAGTLGILLATPLVAVALLLVKMLYVEDLLGGSEKSPEANVQAQRGN